MAFRYIGPIEDQSETSTSLQKSSGYTYIGKVDSEDNIPLQYGLGLARNVTFPLDLLKISAMGAGQDALYSEEPDPMLNKDIAQQKMNEVIEYFPTQDSIEKGIENITGVNLQPQTASGKIARSTGEFTSPRGLLKSGGKAIARKLLAPIGGAVVEQGLEEAGVPAPIAGLVGVSATNIGEAGKIIPKKLSKEGEELRKTSEKFNLAKPRLMEYEKPLFKGSVSKGQSEKLGKNLEESSSKAIESVIREQIPIKKLEERGYNLSQATNKAYEMAERKAAQSKGIINIDPVIDYLEKEIESVSKSAPSLSLESEKYLDLLRKEYSKLKDYDLTPKEVLKQYQEFNKNLKNIYRKPEFSSMEGKVKDFYSTINQKLLESSEKSGQKEFADSFRYANKLYSEKSKLRNIENSLSKYIGENFNPEKLSKDLKNPKKRPFFERNLGERGVKDLEEISLYGKKASEKIKKSLKIKENTLPAILKEEGPTALLGALSYLSGYGYEIPTVALLGKKISSDIYGRILSSESTRKDYLNVLKAITSGSEKAIIKTSKKLNESYSKLIDEDE